MNRVAIDLGFIQIYWYSICILIGMLGGIILVLRESKRNNINENSMTDLIFWTVIWGVIGARLYYVLFNLDYYSIHRAEVFEIWNGGLAIHGGILFGLFYVLYFCHRRKHKILRITDICAPGLLVGQIIGRWGNFFNQEAYGPVIEKATLEKFPLPKFIVEGMNINGEYHQPTFLYESLWNILGLIILLIFRRLKYIREGQITGFYLIWYSIGRFIIEIFRQDSLMIGNFKVAQIVSVILAIVGLVLLLFRIRKPKFEFLYNDTHEEMTSETQ